MTDQEIHELDREVIRPLIDVGVKFADRHNYDRDELLAHVMKTVNILLYTTTFKEYEVKDENT